MIEAEADDELKAEDETDEKEEEAMDEELAAGTIGDGAGREGNAAAKEGAGGEGGAGREAAGADEGSPIAKGSNTPAKTSRICFSCATD